MALSRYQSLVHNFTQSFISVDYEKDHHFAINVLIDLHNQGHPPQATFDFVNGELCELATQSNESLELLNYYANWLPEHFGSQSAELDKLEKLEITICTMFINTDNESTFKVSALTKWKVQDWDEQRIELHLHEIMPKKVTADQRIPRIKPLIGKP